MELMSYDDHPKMIIDDGHHSENSQDYLETTEVPTLEDIRIHLSRNPSIYTQILDSERLGNMILAAPLHPHSDLVDLSPIRLNIYLKDGSGPIAELVSMSRDQISSALITTLQDLDQLIFSLLHNYTYCRGYPEEQLKDRSTQLPLRDIFIHPYNGNVIVRSRKCQYVCDRNLVDNICQNCKQLWMELNMNPGEPANTCQDTFSANFDEEVKFKIIEDESSEVETKPNFPTEPIETTSVPLIEDNKPMEDAKKGQPKARREKSKAPPRKKQRVLQSCQVCHKQFSFQKHLEKHIRNNPDGSCKENADYFDDFSPASPLNPPSPDFEDIPSAKPKKPTAKHECTICSKQFAKKAVLNIHMISHSDTKGFLCVDCGTEFKRQSSLINHRKRIHLGLKFHKCTECEKEFYSKKEIDDHMRLHTGDKPFQCPQCGKCFARSAHLKRHTDKVHSVKEIHQMKNEQQSGTETIIIRKFTKKKSYKTLKALLNKPTPDLILPSSSSTQHSTPSGFILGHSESLLPPKIVATAALPHEGLAASSRPSIVRVTSSNPQQLPDISLLGTAAKPTTFTTITNRHNIMLKSQPSPMGLSDMSLVPRQPTTSTSTNSLPPTDASSSHQVI